MAEPDFPAFAARLRELAAEVARWRSEATAAGRNRYFTALDDDRRFMEDQAQTVVELLRVGATWKRLRREYHDMGAELGASEQEAQVTAALQVLNRE